MSGPLPSTRICRAAARLTRGFGKKLADHLDGRFVAVLRCAADQWFAVGTEARFLTRLLLSLYAGAPVDWQPLEPVPSQMGTTSVAKTAPRPHAAMLFTDFLLSEEGQKVFQRADYLPAHPKILAQSPELKPGGGRFAKANYFHPETVMEQSDKWLALQEKIFTKQRSTSP